VSTVTSTVELTPSEVQHWAVTIPTEVGVTLRGDLSVPAAPVGVVVSPHAGGSDLDPRRPKIIDVLNGAGFATLAFDLLTEEEALERVNVFDVPVVPAATHNFEEAGALEQVDELAVAWFTKHLR
jgi:hypothetical protein